MRVQNVYPCCKKNQRKCNFLIHPFYSKCVHSLCQFFPQYFQNSHGFSQIPYAFPGCFRKQVYHPPCQRQISQELGQHMRPLLGEGDQSQFEDASHSSDLPHVFLTGSFPYSHPSQTCPCPPMQLCFGLWHCMCVTCSQHYATRHMGNFTFHQPQLNFHSSLIYKVISAAASGYFKEAG